MSSELIFLTGVTGFIGAATAQKALQAGYRLRLAVRKEAAIEKTKAIFSEYSDKIEFVVVPDITAENAFAKFLDGVDYILHLASPLANSTNAEEVFKPAVEGTLAILKDAAKVASVKKVVITSSIASLAPLSGVPEGGVIKEDTDWDLSVDRNQNWDAGHPDITRFRIYTASKLLANQASWDYVNTEKPHFALVTLHPAFVYGHNLVQSSAAEIQGSTNGLLFGSVMNGPSSDSTLSSVYVGDVAEAQIRSLRPEIKSGSKYFLSGPRVTWKEVAEVLQKYYPNVPTKVVSTEKSTVPLTDTSKAERELGIQFAKPEVFIREVMDQQLAFLSKK